MAEIAIERYQMILERARALYARPKDERRRERRTLAASQDYSDRYVAAFVKEWMSNPHG